MQNVLRIPMQPIAISIQDEVLFSFSELHGRTLHSTLYNTTGPMNWLTYNTHTLFPLLPCKSLIPARLLDRSVNWESRYFWWPWNENLCRHFWNCSRVYLTMLWATTTISTMCASSTKSKYQTIGNFATFK